MLRRCVLHTTIAAVMAALPIAATRAASARVAQAVSNPHDYTYSDPNIIDPSCRSKPDPLDCSADVGARELAAADALGDINLNLRRAAARDVDESKPHRSIRRGFNTRQLVDFGAEQSEAIEKIVNTKIKVHRLFVRWWDVQCAGSDQWRFQRYYDLVSALHDKGVNVILTPVGSPNWARTKSRKSPVVDGDDCQLTKNPDGSDRALAPFAHGDNNRAWSSFIQQMVINFKPLGVIGYEIWNEQNSRNFWDATGHAPPTAQPPSPGAWALLYCRAAGQIDALDQGKPVGVGGLAVYESIEHDMQGRITNVRSSAFLNGAYKARRSLCRNKPFDFVGYHPYAYRPVINHNFTDFAHAPAARELTAIRTVMRSRGQAAINVWNTEWGFPSDFGGITKKRQAALIKREHSYLANVKDRGRLFMQFSIMFNAVDGDPNATNVFEHVGVLTAALDPKQPTYNTWTALP